MDLAQCEKGKPTVLSTLILVLDREKALAFIAHRRALRCALTVRADELTCQTLEKIDSQGGDAGQAIDIAIERGWRTIKPDWYFKAIAETGVESSRPLTPLEQAEHKELMADMRGSDDRS